MKKVCLTVAGSDSGGGAGIQQDLKTFASLGVHGVCAVTALTSQNTQGVRDVYPVVSKFLESQLLALLDDFRIASAKTGMLYSSENIELVARHSEGIKLVVDPVMVATSGDILLEKEAIRALREELFPKAMLITPNIREAEVLTGIKISSPEEMEEAALQLGSYADVLLKGGDLDARDVLCSSGEIYSYKGYKAPGRFHGTGCTYSSAITAYLGRGYDLRQSAHKAKQYIQQLLENSLSPGKGARVLDPIYPLNRRAEKSSTIEEHYTALRGIMKLEGLEKLIPEVGINFVYSLPEPKSYKDVAALNGRIIKVAGRASATGCIEFGASKHVAGVVLAANRLSPDIMAGMNIKFNPEILEACRKAGLNLSTFDRSREPGDVSTMEWGTAQAMKGREKPDIIYDEGGIGKEAMVRILGSSPEDVMGKVSAILAGLR